MKRRAWLLASYAIQRPTIHRRLTRIEALFFMDFPSIDAASVAALLATLAGIPLTILPDECRQALAESIRCGDVDGLYTPLGSDQYNVTFSAWPPALDPRMTLSAWVAAWQAGRSPSDAHAAAQLALQQNAWQAARQNGGAR